MIENISKSFEQASVFQKMWMDSCAKMTGVLAGFSPASPAPEEMRKMRTGTLKVLAETWEEFMRTPQFMEMMKTWVSGALNLRQMSREGMDRVHEQFNSPDKEDIDGILLAIRHVERRVLDRLEEVDERVEALGERVAKFEERNKKAEDLPKRRPKEVPPRKRKVVSKKRITK